jgi:hypothetical protein
MFNKILKGSFSIIVISTLFSCEGQTDYSTEVNNRTESPITVYAVTDFASNVETQIQPGETTNILTTEQRGGNYSAVNPSGWFSSFLIVNAQGDTCTKDHTNQQLWNGEIKRIRRAPATMEQKYTLIVNPEDF